jgi:hypothetical protein
LLRPTSSSSTWLVAGGSSGRSSSTGQQHAPIIEAYTTAGSSGGSSGSGSNSNGSSGGSRGSNSSGSRPLPSHTQSIHYTESASVCRSRSLRFTEEGSFAFSAPAPAPDEFSSTNDHFADLMQQALSAGEAAGSRGIAGSLRQAYQRPARGAGLPSPPGFVPSPLGFVSTGQHALQTSGCDTSSTNTNSGSSRSRSSGRSNPHAAAPEGAEHAGDAAIGAAVEGIAAMGPVQRTGRIEHSIEVRQELHQTVTQTARFTVSGGGGVSSSSRPAGTGSFGLATGRAAGPEYAKRIGTAGEVFLFGWLNQRLPGFAADNWCSGNRVHLPGDQQLQPPTAEPSFDFVYTDEDGKLTGEPDTLCYIECKATSADVSSQLMPIQITTLEWELAQQVHAERLAGAKCQYILFRVDRGGPARRPQGGCYAGQPSAAVG